jgi:hypothetical protein
MRLIKKNTMEYESFHKSLQYFTKNSEASGDLRLISFENHRNNTNMLEKYSFFVQNLYSFQKKVQNIEDVKDLCILFQEFVKRMVFAKEVEIFLFNDSRRNLIPLNTEVSHTHLFAVNKTYKDGVLDWIFETKKPTIIPDLNSYTINGSRINQIIFPVYDKKSVYGLLSIITPISKMKEDSLESQSIQLLLGIIMPLVISLKQKQSINKLHQEVQIYQSKLNNDFDIYAVGELAEGLLEDIGDSMQVILSCVDVLDESKLPDKSVTSRIKEQVNKLSGVSSRITKFAGINKSLAQRISPCDMNEVVRDFRNIIDTTLNNCGLECELDLEENIPPVLTDPQEVKQMLTGIFSIIKNDSQKGGAVVIQTKYVKEKIVLSVFTTEQVVGLSNNKDLSSNITVKFINELMKKSEGIAEFNVLPLKGTIIHLVFPLKRKLPS